MVFPARLTVPLSPRRGLRGKGKRWENGPENGGQFAQAIQKKGTSGIFHPCFGTEKVPGTEKDRKSVRNRQERFLARLLAGRGLPGETPYNQRERQSHRT